MENLTVEIEKILKSYFTSDYLLPKIMYPDSIPHATKNIAELIQKNYIPIKPIISCIECDAKHFNNQNTSSINDDNIIPASDMIIPLYDVKYIDNNPELNQIDGLISDIEERISKFKQQNISSINDDNIFP